MNWGDGTVNTWPSVSEARPRWLSVAVATALVLGAGCFESGPVGSGPDVAGQPPDAGPIPDGVVVPDIAGQACTSDQSCTVLAADKCAAQMRCVNWTCQLDPATAVVCDPPADPCYTSSCSPELGVCQLEDVCQCEPLATPLTCQGEVSFSTFDPGGTFVLDGYSCGIYTGAGMERVWLFEAAVTQNVLLTVTGEGLQELYVLHGGGQGCEPSLCVAFGGPQVAFQASAGVVYAIVAELPPGDIEGAEIKIALDCGIDWEVDCANGVDDDQNGLTDCQEPSCIGVGGCPSQFETLCSDGVDDDLDGFMDCLDPDCTYAVDCLEACETEFVSNQGCSFGQAFQTNTGSASSTAYAIGPAAPGKEIVYPFSTPELKTVTVTLDHQTVGAGLYVMQDKGHGCTPKDCIAFGPTGTIFPAWPGITYYLAVDGPAGLDFAYSISVDCN